MSRLTLVSRAAAVLLLVTATGAAQLAGTYSIDNSATTGGGNYATFIDAAAALTSQGVSGPTTFIVSPGIANYAGFALGLIPGTSPTNVVTFVAAPAGPRPIISGAATSFVQAVRFGTNTSTSSTGMNTGPSYVVFDGFEITGSGSGAAFLALGCNFITVRNCVAHTAGSGIGLTVSFNCTIEDCEVYGTTHTPGTGGSTSYSGGIWAYSLAGNNLIQRNRIHDCADNGIFIGSSGSTTATPNNTVINNLVWNCGTQTSTTYSGGIALRRATSSIVANNSVSMPAGVALPGIYLMGGSSTAPLLVAELSNNIVQHNGTGACFQTEYIGQYGTINDYNLYDAAGGGPVAGTGTSATSPSPYATLAAWQAASGVDTNSVSGSAGFVAANDLHITPASPAFNAGSIVAAVTDDIDMQPRPLGGLADIGADEAPATGIFAAFTASVVAGGAPLTVNFTDTSFSSDPGGILTWAWDFDGNGTTDSTLQNPSFTYLIPGTYTVALTVMDLMNGSDTRIRFNYITVSQYQLIVQTSGGGVGDLSLIPVPHYGAPTSTTGYLFISLNTSLPTSAGPFFGIVPDIFTWMTLTIPPTVGDLFHWVYVPGNFPDISIILPPGAAVSLAGLTIDFVQVDLTATFGLANVSNVARAAF